MKKSDIKNGMHVITNDDVEYIVISGIEAQGQIRDNYTANTIMIQINDDGWMPFDDYDDNLHYHDPEANEFDDDDSDRYYDIKAVYAPTFYAWTLSSVYNKELTDKFTKVWERTFKKMTKAEIEKELGYEIEIVESEEE